MRKQEKENENKRRLAGTIFSMLFAGLIIGILFAFNMPKQETPPIPEVKILMDFSGGSKKGGSSSAKTEAVVEEASAAENVKTQKTESVVKKTSSKTDSKSKSTSNKKSTSTKKANSKALAGSGMFGNNTGNGSGDSDGDGDGDGDGNGIGAGVGDKIGDGRGRKRISMPNISNPANEEGTVAVKILILKSGKVESATVLRGDSRTTTSNPAHLSEAKRKAMQFKFNAKSNASEYEEKVITIKFILQ